MWENIPCRVCQQAGKETTLRVWVKPDNSYDAYCSAGGHDVGGVVVYGESFHQPIAAHGTDIWNR